MSGFVSTRGGKEPISSARALLNGLAENGGLYVPASTLPKLKPNADFREMAHQVLLAAFGDCFSSGELRELVDKRFTPERFEHPDICPLRDIARNKVLELFHGPTASFKDIALSLLPGLMALARRRLAPDKDILVLTATSGDTGSATMAGFRDLEGIRVIVFYPRKGISPVQEAQMQRMQGSNLKAVAIRGDFDQAQRGVKEIFLRRQEIAPNTMLSSANSINIGRLLPQSAYFLSAAAQSGREGPLCFSVPTGNFGNILAGHLAGQLGMPWSQLVCATNRNDVLKICLESGVYDRRRTLHKTLSPSMDILLASNFERAIYLAAGGDTTLTASLMHRIERDGRARLPETVLDNLRTAYAAASCSDEEALDAMRACCRQTGFLTDPHTASALHALGALHMEPGVVLATASPYKFPAAALAALGEPVPEQAQQQMQRLCEVSGTPIPRALVHLFEQPVLHDECIEPRAMASYVKEKLEQW